MKTEVYETRHVNYRIEDGILIGVFVPGIYITFDIVSEMVEQRIKFCNGRTLPALIDIRGIVSIDTPSRKYLTGERAKVNMVAGAIVVGSLVSRMAGNIFIAVDKPSLPTKLFNDPDKAIKWLAQFKKK
ncbi:MAG TPA: hypothetical protein VK783_14385 [Bacteroidia bacterium]|jgi:hypothetical protein|nr:hypothetical protein [Bacteroidia bacterium]